MLEEQVSIVEENNFSFEELFARQGITGCEWSAFKNIHEYSFDPFKIHHYTSLSLLVTCKDPKNRTSRSGKILKRLEKSEWFTLTRNSQSSDSTQRLNKKDKILILLFILNPSSEKDDVHF